MPYAKNGEISIYYEVEGKGLPLVMLHGLSGCGDGWRDSCFVDALKDDCRIILMDCRGHGKSDKPYDPALYGGTHNTEDVKAVLDDVGIAAANLFGYSYGGGLTFECAKRMPQRIISIICGGCGARLPDREMVEGQIAFYGAGPEAMLKTYEQVGPVPPKTKEHILANDSQALVAICRAMLTEKSLLEDVPKMKMPFLIFAGDNDFTFAGAKETYELLPNAIFVSLPGLDHFQAGSYPELIVPQIKGFLSRVNGQ
jgi:pimeloyl-ACP methyl ester carboxylesterase